MYTLEYKDLVKKKRAGIHALILVSEWEPDKVGVRVKVQSHQMSLHIEFYVKWGKTHLLPVTNWCDSVALLQSLGLTSH